MVPGSPSDSQDMTCFSPAHTDKGCVTDAYGMLLDREWLRHRIWMRYRRLRDAARIHTRDDSRCSAGVTDAYGTLHLSP